MHSYFFILQAVFITLVPLGTNGLTFLSNEILDLESNTTYFETESSYWTATNTLSTFASTQCGGTWLLGGYGVTTQSTTFSRDYSSLPSHNEIYFSFLTWYIDLHQQVDLFGIYIDGQLIQDLNTRAINSFNPPTNFCGASRNDFAGARVDGKVIHSSSSLNFKLVVKFDPATDDFSVGFRHLSLLFYKSSAPTNQVCQMSPTSLSAVSCLCPLGQYDVAGPTGCAMCASNCKTCTGPTSTDCTSCPVGSSFDGTACFSCDASCLQCTGAAGTDCVRCDSSSFLYWNRTCQGSCTAPLVITSEGEYQNCSLPCSSSSDFYFENSTCGSSCPVGNNFTQVSNGDLKLCNFICGSGYLYSDGSCLASCPSPFILVVQGVERYCEIPCSTGDYYDLETKKCVSTCTSPSEIVMINSVPACKSNAVESTTEIFGSFLESIFAGSNIIGEVIRPNNHNSAFMAALAKLLKYVQYLDVPFPQEIRDQLSPNYTSGGFCLTQMFSYAMPDSLKEQFPRYSLPPEVEQSGVHSSYLVNHWATITTYLFLFGLAIVSTGLEKLVISWMKEWKGAIAVVTRLRILLKWNFLLFAFFNTYDDLTFFAVLELKTLHLNSALEILSFVVCLITSTFAIFLLYKAWVSCKESLEQREKKIENMESSDHSISLFYKKWEDFQVLYAGLKQDSRIKQYYLFIYIMRIIVYYLVAGLLEAYPRLQTLHYLLWSVFMIIILLRYRPILDPFAYFVDLTYETLILIVNICLVILADFGASGELSESTVYGLSKTVLVCNSLVYFFSNIFAWVYILTGLIAAYKINKKKGLNAKTVWLSVPVSPYSNPGMDYDELTYLETMENSGYPQRTRIPQRIAKNKILPLNLGGDSDIEASLKNALSSIQQSSRSCLVVQRDTSDGQLSGTFCKNFENAETSPESAQKNEHTFRHSMNFSQAIFINRKRKGSAYSSDSGPNETISKPQPIIREKDLSMSIDLNKGNTEDDEEKLKVGVSGFLNSNVSTYSNTHSFSKSSPGNRPLGRPNSIIIESLELENNEMENSPGQKNPLIFPMLQNDSPILHSDSFHQQGSLCATYLTSGRTLMNRRKSLFGRGGVRNFQQTMGSLEVSPVNFIHNSSLEKLPIRRKISRNEEMNFSSILKKVNSND